MGETESCVLSTVFNVLYSCVFVGYVAALRSFAITNDVVISSKENPLPGRGLKGESFS